MTKLEPWTEEEVQARVEYGIKELNKRCKNWHMNVNLTTLNMGGCFSCILGQLAGNYEAGLQKYFNLKAKTNYKKCQNLGFIQRVCTSFENDDIKLMNKVWKEKIKELRKENELKN